MFLLAVTLPTVHGFAANSITVASPDEKVRLELQVATPANLSYKVTFRDKPVIEKSALNIVVDKVELTQGIELGKAETYRINAKYPWRGVHAEAVNHCQGARIPITHVKSGATYTLEVRSFNNGVAFRHILPGDGRSRVPDEATQFILPEQSIVWYHDLEGHYEDVHEKKAVSDVALGQWVAPPFTFKLPGSGGYASITEAALFNYSGMALQADGKRGFNLVLGHKHPVSYPYRLRYSNEIERVSKPAVMTGTITSPWRVIMLAADLNALVNCDVVHNLCAPPDPELFPKGMKADWIKPGRAVWKYVDGGGANSFDLMKEFSRWAGELGFEYHVIEGFWSRWSDDQIKELVDYSRQRGVGLWFWKHSRQLRTPEAREEFFVRLHKLGVVGAKIDFFDHEHKDIVDLYSALLRDAAKHRIMVNFHGANKPTGEARTWPNEMIREGVRGMEASRLQSRARHNTTLPFTRYLAGHGDYTPVHFGERRRDTTWAHQVATAAIFDEPLLTYGAHPTNLLNNPCLPMIKRIPATWDETIVLPISEIGEIAAFARRSGDTWFLAVLNGPEEDSIRVPLSFLRPGEYEGLLIGDHKTNPAAVEIENIHLHHTDSLELELSAGGGFIGRFVKP